MIKIEIWASGSGSNAENLCNYFHNHPSIQVASIMTNNPKAGVVERANRLQKDVQIVSLEDIKSGAYLETMLEREIDLIVLAGYLKLVPEAYVKAFDQRIINVHPALLPKYGGKGMYGERVHKAVLEAKEAETGISIHLVNQRYDEGRVLAQFSLAIEPSENLESLQAKIHSLEHTYLPVVVEQYLLNQL